MATQANISVGRRKESVARVRLAPGTGNITINGRTMDVYFGRETSKMILVEPLKLVDQMGKLDVFVTARGRRALGPGRRDPPRHQPRPLRPQPRVPAHPQEGRVHDARRARGRAQEVRPPRRPQALPVLEALEPGRSAPRFTTVDRPRGGRPSCVPARARRSTRARAR